MFILVAHSWKWLDSILTISLSPPPFHPLLFAGDQSHMGVALRCAVASLCHYSDTVAKEGGGRESKGKGEEIEKRRVRERVREEGEEERERNERGGGGGERMRETVQETVIY